MIQRSNFLSSVLFFTLIISGNSPTALAGTAQNAGAKAVPRTGANFLLLEGLFTRPSKAEDEQVLKKSMSDVKGGAKLAAITGKLVGVSCKDKECTLKVDAVTRWETDGRGVTSAKEKNFEFRGGSGNPLYGIAKGLDMGWASFMGTGKGVNILAKNWESKIKNAGQHVTILYLTGNGRGDWKEIGSFSRVIVHDPAAAMKPEEISERLKDVYSFLGKGS